MIDIEYSLVIDWFRQKYNFHIEFQYGKDKSSVWYCPVVYSLVRPNDNDGVIYNDLYEPLAELEQEEFFYKAREIAIIKCLEICEKKMKEI